MKKTTTQLLFGAAFALTMILPSAVSADIMVEEEFSGVVGTALNNTPVGNGFDLGSINVGSGDLLVVGVAFEAAAESLDLGTALVRDGDFANPIEAEVFSNHSGFQQTAIFVIEDVSGTLDLQLFTDGPSINAPGFYAVSLSGADGVEATGSALDTGGRTATTFDLAGDGEISEGSFVLAAYSDELGGGSPLAQGGVTVDGNLSGLDSVQQFDGAAGNFIGSAVGAIATGFVPSEDDLDGAGLFVSFSDVSPFISSNASNQRSNFSFVSIAPTTAAVPEPGSVIVLALAGLAATTRRRRQ